MKKTTLDKITALSLTHMAKKINSLMEIFSKNGENSLQSEIKTVLELEGNDVWEQEILELIRKEEGSKEMDLFKKKRKILKEVLFPQFQY